MKKLLSLLSLILISGCGKYLDIPHETDPFFLPLIAQYKKDSQKYNTSEGDFFSITVFKFADLSNAVTPDTIATCHYYWDENTTLLSHSSRIAYKEIIFSPPLKNRNSSFQYQVFLHEVGHCAYHLSHNSSSSLSIMYPIAIPFLPAQFEAIVENFFKDAQDNKNNWFNENLP